MKINEYVSGVGSKIEDNVIQDVLVLGPDSKNKRKYTKSCMSKACNLYDGARVYVDHVEGAPRKVEDRWGSIKNPRVTDDGIRADLEFMDSHAVSARVKEDVEKGLNYFGLSHCVEGKAKKTQEGVTVHEISKIYSVDLVAEPATTSNLFEQEETEETTEIVEEENTQETDFLAVLREENSTNDEKMDKIRILLGEEEVVEEEKEEIKEETISEVDELKSQVAELTSKISDMKENIYLKPVSVVAEEEVEVNLKETAKWIKGE